MLFSFDRCRANRGRTAAAAAVLLAAASGVALMQASVAQAQDVPQPAGDTGEHDIIVTAQKRSESINSVGLSVVAISGETLAQRRITSLQDVAAAIPGLSYSMSQTNTPIFTLRGVGFNESSLGVYPAVSVYMDEAPIPFPALAAHSAYDLERIEVLKGPQGILFGQNSTGGTINYVAAKPTRTFQAGGDIGYGRFNRVEGNAFVSGPLSPTLGARLSITGVNADGWQRSSSRPGDTNGKTSYVAGRLILQWDPSDAVRITTTVNGWRDTSDPLQVQLVAVVPKTVSAAKPSLLNYPLTPGGNRDADWSDGPYEPRARSGYVQGVLRGDFTVADGIVVTSLTNYNYFKRTQTTDFSGLSLIVGDLIRADGSVHSFNQELRIAGNHDRITWLLGANYEDSRTQETQDMRFSDSTSNNAANLFINASGVNNHQSIRNYAFFGNAEFEIAPGLKIKGGARYTNSRIKANICGFATGDLAVNNLFNLLGSRLGTVPFTPLRQGDCYSLNQNSVPGQEFVSTLKEDNVSWRGGIDYEVAPHALVYANVSRGYKAGSYPSLAASTYVQLQPVKQEEVTAYEAGVKLGLFNRKVQLNGAAFYYDYRDKQIRGKIFDPVFRFLDALVNVPKSRIFGVEAEATVYPTDGLTIGGAITYLDSKIRQYVGTNPLGVLENNAGDALPFTPKWSYSVNVDYRVKSFEKGVPFVGFTVNGRSSTDAYPGGSRFVFPASPINRVLPGLTNVFKMPAYATVDARAGFETSDGRWRMSVWGKNIFNKVYTTNVLLNTDTTGRFVGMPATYGVTIGFKY